MKKSNLWAHSNFKKKISMWPAISSLRISIPLNNGGKYELKFHPNQTTFIDTYKTNFSWCLKRMKMILKCEVNERWAVGNDFTTFTSSRARSFVCLKSRSVLLRCDVGVDRLCVRLLLLLILLHSTTLTLLLPPSPHHTLIRYILNSAIEEFQVYLFMCHNIMIVVLCFVVSSSSSSQSVLNESECEWIFMIKMQSRLFLWREGEFLDFDILDTFFISTQNVRSFMEWLKFSRLKCG